MKTKLEDTTCKGWRWLQLANNRVRWRADAMPSVSTEKEKAESKNKLLQQYVTSRFS